MYDTHNAILNKIENASLQYSIFCEKVLDKKYFVQFCLNVFQNPANDSSKLHQFVSFDV